MHAADVGTSRPRTLRFAVTGSLLATATLGLVARGCVAGDDASPSAREGEVPGDTEGSDESFGETVVNPGPQLDVGGPVAPEVEIAAPPPPVVNPGRVQSVR